MLTTIVLERRLPFLRDGMTVDVDIVTHEEAHVLTVPTDAIRQDDRGSYVFLVRNGRTLRAPVTLGAQNDADTVVKSGVSDGDTVVAEKNADLKANAAVRPAPTPTPGSSPTVTTHE